MWISNISIKRPVFATMVILSFMVLGDRVDDPAGHRPLPRRELPVRQRHGGLSRRRRPRKWRRSSPSRSKTRSPASTASSGSSPTRASRFSRVGIELRLEVDAQAAAAEVREKVAAIRDRLPKDIEDPTILRFDVAALPIMTYAVGSTQPSDVTRRQIEDELKPLLEQIDGVAAVDVNGGEVREIQVNLDPGRLEALSLPLSRSPRNSPPDNLDVPAGTVIREGQNISLRTKGEFQSVDEIENVILRSDGGSTVRLNDVGDGRRRLRGAHVARRGSNGVDAVSFSVRKQSGANTVEIARARRARRWRGFAPVSRSSQCTRSTTTPTSSRTTSREVRRHIIFGGIMAVLVIFVFMRDWRSTLISALALPTSVIATFFFMYVAGFTINMMTLMALSLVIGILIDDAVVVRENIYRHMEHGEDPMTAARNGTAQIGLAVMATTFTILAVFLPVGFMTGHRRAVLQVVRADDCLRRVDVAARRVHARPDAVVAVRALRPARGADAHAHRPAARALGSGLRSRSIACTTACSSWALDRPWTRPRHGGGDVHRQPVAPSA